MNPMDHKNTHTLFRGKGLVLTLWASGAVCTGYGMIRQNDPIFVVGIVLLIAGYYVIRKELKASITRKKDPSGTAPPDQ